MLPTIKINGQEKYFLFNLVAICKFEESTGESVTNTLSQGENMPINILVKMIHEGLKEGHRKAMKEALINTEFDLQWEDVAETLQESPEDIAEAFETLADQVTDVTAKKKKQTYSQAKKKSLQKSTMKK